MNVLAIVSRAFSSNLGALPVSPAEQAALAGQGVVEPTAQRYTLWRRATLVMVIVATLLSAAVSTYRNYTETEDQPDFTETLTNTFLKKLKATSPTAAALVKAAQQRASDTPEEKPGTAAEAKSGGAKEGDGEDADEEEGPKPAFVHVQEVIDLVALYILPATAFLALLFWRKFRLSYYFLVAGFGFSFLVPMLIELCPWSWWGVVEPAFSPTADGLKYLKSEAEGALEGASAFAALLPSVLSLIPGVQRACLRIKSLLPQSLLPGWLVVTAAPLYGLFLLVAFIAFDQVVSNGIILFSFALIVLPSLIYAFRASVFTRPLLTEADLRRLKGVQRLIGGMTGVAGLVLVSYLATREVLGLHLVGTDPKHSLMQPIDLVEFLLEVISRSMFVSALGADFILRMNRNAWQHAQALAASPSAAIYAGAMAGVEAIV